MVNGKIRDSREDRLFIFCVYFLGIILLLLVAAQAQMKLRLAFFTSPYGVRQLFLLLICARMRLFT